MDFTRKNRADAFAILGGVRARPSFRIAVTALAFALARHAAAQDPPDEEEPPASAAT